MKYNKDLFSFIESEYYKKVYKKIKLIESILNLTFLQELKVKFKFNWDIKDVIIIFWDIEWFSYKSYENMICELKLYNNFFNFINYSYIKSKLKNIFNTWNNNWIDQYIWISLLTWNIVEYYWIIGWIKIIKDIVNINFRKDYRQKLGKEFPIINSINDSVIWNIYVGNLSENIWEIKKEIFFYDMSIKKFYLKLDNIFNQIKSDILIWFLNCYKNIDEKYFWKEFICWSWYNDNKIISSTLEFFLKSKKRKTILKDLFFFNQNNFIDPYICQLWNNEVIMWFLVKESYEKRLEKWYYYYY